MSLLIIPATQAQADTTAKMIIQSYGLAAVQTAIYKPQIDGLLTDATKGKDNTPSVNGRDYGPGIDAVYQSTVEGRTENPKTGAESDFGTPVFSNLVLKAREYLDSEGNTVKTFKNDVVLNTVLFDVGQQKNIVTTAVQGLGGTVKEFISDGDYTLNIKGVIVGKQNGQFPLELAKDLHEALKMSAEIEVSSWYLMQVFGISNIVVTNFQYNQEMGRQRSVAFEIQALSDKPVEIRLKKLQ
jgi:hypothetical protein